MEAFLPCDLCTLDFNANDRVAKLLPACGHTLCSYCIDNALPVNEDGSKTCTLCGVTSKIINAASLLTNDKLMTIVKNFGDNMAGLGKK